ncbi:MAG TPA: DnaA/Hda family protein, partial [Burkholderiales bacterium]|nr:DnaA/Hda family protein [Burkholderiales bacterium]
MEKFWQACLDRFKSELTAQQFNTWIKPLRLEMTGDSYALVTPSPFVMLWIKDRFLQRIEQMAEEFFGEPFKFDLVSSEAQTPSQKPSLPQAQPQSKYSLREQSRLNKSFTFDNFVPGKANQLARAAAIQIAENPGIAYNPLFIYGGVGLGKTHLIQAIGNLVHDRHPDAKIRYTHAEQYVSDVVKAYRHKAFDDFKQYYHSLDLLLIDDIQ